MPGERHRPAEIAGFDFRVLVERAHADSPDAVLLDALAWLDPPKPKRGQGTAKRGGAV